MEDNWDLIIIGGGPAGLTSGIYGARSGLRTLILEKMIPGGCILEANIVQNYPGFPKGISGQELANKMHEQCLNEGAEIYTMENVTDIEINDEIKVVTTNNGRYFCKSIIIAAGTQYRKIGIPSEDKFHGRGISYCALCDGPLFKNRDLIVVGGGNCAAIDAIYLSNLASSVKLVHRRSALRAEKAHIKTMENNGVEILYNHTVKEFKGDNILKSVILYNNSTGDLSEIDIDGVFVEIGRIPNTEIAEKCGVELSNDGYIVVDEYQKTNIEGIFAAGDITISPYRQIGTAIGNGIIAASEAYGYIKKPYYHKNKN
jgi:thioredoxin reductase (NADPH)